MRSSQTVAPSLTMRSGWFAVAARVLASEAEYLRSLTPPPVAPPPEGAAPGVSVADGRCLDIAVVHCPLGGRGMVLGNHAGKS
jgi:hypothetical protein